ncbi:MAG TPA: DUF4202 family protein [Thermoanaerobaculia bacterium]|nr:DUF4202 family protein [Thermoanaerobaculia bacterium]
MAEACLERAAADVEAELGMLVEVGTAGSAGFAGGLGKEKKVLRLADWESEVFDFWAFDRLLDDLAAAEAPLILTAPRERLPAMAWQVATRAQRLSGRRNQASSGELFDRALARHRALHDLGLPLVRADYDHALDVWRWLLRLDPRAGLAVQLAALFHDVERLESEALVRREPQGLAYQAAKNAHAERGARTAAALLAQLGVAPATCERAARLIALHDRGGESGGGDREPGRELGREWAGFGTEAARLTDADALSFFSLNSPGYLAYHGPEATRRKVAWTLGRMRPAARERLAGVRLPAQVRGFLEDLDRDAWHSERRPAPPPTSGAIPSYLEKKRPRPMGPGSPPSVARGHAP